MYEPYSCVISLEERPILNQSMINVRTRPISFILAPFKDGTRDSHSTLFSDDLERWDVTSEFGLE